jgi:hypothetical protein
VLEKYLQSGSVVLVSLVTLVNLGRMLVTVLVVEAAVDSNVHTI